MRPTPIQKKWLSHGLTQAGGKLPLFDENGQQFSARTVRACVKAGWAEPWRHNPIKPDWMVCRLTAEGRLVTAEEKIPSQKEAELVSRT